MQNNNRLGCFTGTGIFAGLIAVVVIFSFIYFSGGAIFSPGELNNINDDGQVIGGVLSHAQIPQCKSCHAEFWSADKMSDRCQDCHSDVAAQLRSTDQFHGAMLQANPNYECRNCHPDHRGAAASLTEMDFAIFPHDALGFSLSKHLFKADGSALACSDCHSTDITTFASDSCQTCHRTMDIAFADAHLLSYGEDCIDCHDGVDRYGADFDHNKLAFPLVGKHATSTCESCHVSPRTALDLQTVSQECVSCHLENDAHQGAYGTACGVCHSPEAWTPAKFDHNLAAFKLEGEHQQVACEQCHQNNVFKGTPSDCYSCHQNDDEHNGQFGTDCATCHNASSWEDANFDHNLSAFKLDGSHVNVKCEQCHVNRVFKGTPSDCYSCHQNDDEHNGQFGTDCAACHNTGDWDDADFDHNRTALPLDGAHARASCEQCHSGGVFTGLSADCVSCHADPGFHAGAFGTKCVSCHSTSAWSPAAYNIAHPEPRVDEGGSGINHGGATCRQCHPSSVFQSNCDSCHRGGFEGGEGGEDGDD